MTDSRDERRRITIEICALIAAGKSTREIFDTPKRRKGFPGRCIFWRWRGEDEDLAALFQRAIDERILLETEQMVDIADQKPPTVEGKVDQGWVMWQRARVDVRKWNAARRQPKLYGDRTIIAGDADSPLHVELSDPKAVLLRGLAPKPSGEREDGESGGAER